MKKVTFKVDDETHRKARLRAEAEGISVVDLVRNILVSLASAPEADGEVHQVAKSRLDDGRTGALAMTPIQPRAAPEPNAKQPRGRKE